MSTLTTTSYKNDPAGFTALFENIKSPTIPSALQADLERRYRHAETGDGFQDLSFFLSNKNSPIALILAYQFGDIIGFNGSGAEIHGIIPELGKKHITAALDYLLQTARSEKCTLVKIDDLESHTTLSILGQECFNRKGTPQTKLRAQQNLTQSEADLHKQLRKSYSSLVNQGRREITFQYITQSNPDSTTWEQFRAFHKEIAGRETRTKDSWDVQFEMVKTGQTELIAGTMEGYGLVSTALFTDYGCATSYAVAVYNRDLFDKPLAHASVYEGMLRAKQRGQTHFNLGIIPSYDPAIEKEYNIGKFKKGFCRELTPFIEWSIRVEEDQ